MEHGLAMSASVDAGNSAVGARCAAAARSGVLGALTMTSTSKVPHSARHPPLRLSDGAALPRRAGPQADGRTEDLTANRSRRSWVRARGRVEQLAQPKVDSSLRYLIV